MAHIMKAVDCVVAEAKQLADSDDSPQHLGLVGCVDEDNMQDIVGLIYGGQRESHRRYRVNKWLKERHIRRGVEGADNCASRFPCQRPDDDHGFDDEFRWTACRWNSPKEGVDEPPLRPMGSLLSESVGLYIV